MGSAASAPAASPQLYRPRAAEHTVLHRIVREHLATFLRTAQHEGGLPAFVEPLGVAVRALKAREEAGPVATREEVAELL